MEFTLRKFQETVQWQMPNKLQMHERNILNYTVQHQATAERKCDYLQV